MGRETALTAKSLEQWRQEIDILDSELLCLLNQRASIARRIGAVKVASGLPAYDGRREREVLARVRATNPGPFGPESVTRIFRRIILETRKIGTQSMQKQSAKQEPATVTEEHGNGYQHGTRRV